MNRRSRLFRSRLISGAGALVAVIAFFAVPAQAGHAWTTCSDCYIVTPGTNPATAGAGTGGQYAFQVTNNDPHETLRSLTFTAPADFVITGASGPSGTWVSALPGSTVTLKLPSEPYGTTFGVQVTALAPCVAASPEVWGVSGVDSRGETNEVHWSSSPLGVSVTGTCSLAFTGQPAQTAVNSDILTGFNSTGSPLAVQLLDANGDPLNAADFSASGTAVTVSIQANPGGGTLAGTTTVTSSNGVADFGNLQINKAGVGYDLAANAPSFGSATSSPFTITGQIQACGAGSCSVSQSTANTSTSATTTAPGDFAALGLGGVSLACNHYIGVADTADFGIFNSAGNGVPTAFGRRHAHDLQVGARVAAVAVPVPPQAGLLRVADALPDDPRHQRHDRRRRRHLSHRTAAFLLPRPQGALPDLPALHLGGRGPADLRRVRRSHLARVTGM